MEHKKLQDLIDFKDFEVFSKALVNSNDVDPIYPFLKNVIESEGFDPLEAVFWYGYFYSVKTMVRFLRGEIKFEEAKYGIERGRTPQVRDPKNKEKTLRGWHELQPLWEAERSSTSREFAEKLKTVPYFGGWVSYKYTELFEKTLGFNNLAPTDMNIADGNVNGNGGPCGGLRHLYGTQRKYDKSIVGEWEMLGKTLSERWGFDLGEVETCLCKWRKLRVGNYYVGHDIAEITEYKDTWTPTQFEYLMEKSGFDRSIWRPGFVKEHKKGYKDKRILVNSHFSERERNAF